MKPKPVTLEVCSHCGEIAGASAHGHADAPGWDWLHVEYVPAEVLANARLYGEKLLRDHDPDIRRIGADLVQILEER